MVAVLALQREDGGSQVRTAVPRRTTRRRERRIRGCGARRWGAAV
jgi:hypothetical protein